MLLNNHWKNILEMTEEQRIQHNIEYKSMLEFKECVTSSESEKSDEYDTSNDISKDRLCDTYDV